jgi:hypothetical protein
MEICYVYKWTHKPTLKWYVGSRTRKGCHINDGYICSSKYVKPMIKNNPTEWSREIIATGTREEMKELERDILMTTDAMNDSRSFNMSNGCGAMRSFVSWNKGKKGIQVAWNKGLPKEQQPRYGKSNPGKPWSRSEKGEQMIARLKETNRVRNSQQLVCPVCQQAGEGPAMYRWHFANCRVEGGK